MAIYDCFQFFDEEHILELRLNILREISYKKVEIDNFFQNILLITKKN
jgi:hypothetical protein